MRPLCSKLETDGYFGWIKILGQSVAVSLTFFLLYAIFSYSYTNFLFMHLTTELFFFCYFLADSNAYYVTVTMMDLKTLPRTPVISSSPCSSFIKSKHQHKHDILPSLKPFYSRFFFSVCASQGQFASALHWLISIRPTLNWRCVQSEEEGDFKIIFVIMIP